MEREKIVRMSHSYWHTQWTGRDNETRCFSISIYRIFISVFFFLSSFVALRWQRQCIHIVESENESKQTLCGGYSVPNWLLTLTRFSFSDFSRHSLLLSSLPSFTFYSFLILSPKSWLATENNATHRIGVYSNKKRKKKKKTQSRVCQWVSFSFS